MKPVYLVTQKEFFPYFRDYCDGLYKTINFSYIYWDDPGKMDPLIFDPNSLYIFCQYIPDKIRLELMTLKKEGTPLSHIFVINTEQLEHNALGRNQGYIDLGMTVIDYDFYQSRMTRQVRPPRHLYVPYQIYDEEDQYLSKLIQETPKTYDVAFCTVAGSQKRKDICAELKKNNIKVIDVLGWKSQRDKEIAKAKILINIHYTPYYKIFEHFRCDRWVLAGMLVVTEESLSDQSLDFKDLLIIDKYENLTQRVIKILNNYDQYYQSYLAQLDLQKKNIIKERENKCQDFINLLDTHGQSSLQT